MPTETNSSIDEIQSLAAEVFGSPEKARKWLNSNNLALGCPPMDLLGTENGAIEVRRILSAIAKGGIA